MHNCTTFQVFYTMSYFNSESECSPPRKVSRGRGRGRSIRLFESIIPEVTQHEQKSDSSETNLLQQVQDLKLENSQLRTIAQDEEFKNKALVDENMILKQKVRDLTALTTLHNIVRYQQMKDDPNMMQVDLPSEPPTNDADFDRWLTDYTEIIKRNPPNAFLLNSVLFLPEECTQRTTRILLSIIETATKSIDICSYRLSLNGLGNVIDKKKTQNIPVRIIIDGEVLKDTAALGSVIKKIIINHTCSVRTLGNKHKLMHNKFVVIDDRIIMTGSFNWTNKAADENNENVLISIDPAHVRPYVYQFQKLFDEAGSDLKPINLAGMDDVSSHYKNLFTS